jgi:haloacetate dehalogenase
VQTSALPWLLALVADCSTRATARTFDHGGSGDRCGQRAWGWGSDRASFPAQIREAYIAVLRDPKTVHAICEEYRAAATIDFARDTEDREASRRIMCPTLVLWSEGSGLDTWYEQAGGPVDIWRDWTADVRGRPISGGHFFPEQNSSETISELRSFFRLVEPDCAQF